MRKPGASGPERPLLWLPAWALARREVVRFLRQPSRVVGALGPPVLFWMLVGSGFGSSFRAAGPGGDAGYLRYFFPGAVALVLLFTSIFATISVIEDRRAGFLQGVLAAPVSRLAIVAGKVFGGAVLAVGQGMLFVVAAPYAGFPIGLAALPSIAAVMFVIAAGLTALGFLIAWHLDSTQGFHAVMNLFLIPMWLLSGAAFPASGAPAWLAAAIRFNPLTYGVAALRGALEQGAEAPGTPLAIFALFTLVVVCAAAASVARRDVKGLA